jgi:hypothetical protein
MNNFVHYLTISLRDTLATKSANKSRRSRIAPMDLVSTMAGTGCLRNLSHRLLKRSSGGGQHH